MTEEEGTTPLPPLLIPGPLIVSQGLPGDGMSNTLTEPVPEWTDLIRDVVDDDDGLHPEILQAMALWSEESESRRLYRHEEWRELWQQSVRGHAHRGKHQHHQDDAAVSTSWMRMRHATTAWWRCRGKVAVWRTLPGGGSTTTTATAADDDDDHGSSPEVVAALAPGTAVHATALYEWDGTQSSPPRRVLPSSKQSPQPYLRAGGVSPRSCTVTTLWNDDTSAAAAAANTTAQQPEMYPWNSLHAQRRGKCLILHITAPRRGYCVFSVDGYPLLQPGAMRDWARPDGWYWKVTCPVGAYVREGLELATRHVATLPYGTVVRVLRQRVNRAGLPRLRVVAHAHEHTQEESGTQQRQPQPRRLEGWCSTALNPLSGQRGAILQPLPLPRPTVYRIVLCQGAVVRRDVELASPVVGHAPCGCHVTVVARAFTDFPADRAVSRLRLAGGGWISTRLNHAAPHDAPVVECRVDGNGAVEDPSYDPERPALFHYAAQRRAVASQSRAQREQRSPQRQQQEQQSGDDEEDDASMGSSTIRRVGPTTRLVTTTGGVATPSSSPVSATSALTTQTPPPVVSYHAIPNDDNDTPNAPNTPTTTTTTGVHETTASSHPAARPCLCCMENARDATLVHGGTGHIVCCLPCARILQAQGQKCPVCRLDIDLVIKHYFG